MTPGQMLDALRAHLGRGASDRQLAHVLGATPGALSRWRSGDRQPSEPTRRLLLLLVDQPKLLDDLARLVAEELARSPSGFVGEGADGVAGFWAWLAEASRDYVLGLLLARELDRVAEALAEDADISMEQAHEWLTVQREALVETRLLEMEATHPRPLDLDGRPLYPVRKSYEVRNARTGERLGGVSEAGWRMYLQMSAEDWRYSREDGDITILFPKRIDGGMLDFEGYQVFLTVPS